MADLLSSSSSSSSSSAAAAAASSWMSAPLSPIASAAYAVQYGYDVPANTRLTVPSLWKQSSGTYYDTTTCSVRRTSGNGAFNLFMQATSGAGSVCAAPGFGQTIAWLLVLNAFFAGLSSVTVTGRITFALARDNGFPFSEWVKQVCHIFSIFLLIKCCVTGSVSVFIFFFSGQQTFSHANQRHPVCAFYRLYHSDVATEC
jgi:amino acid transporter